MIDWWPVLVAAIGTVVLMPLAIRARSIGHDETEGVQKLHLVPTSRLGGVVMFVVYLATVLAALRLEHVALSAALPLIVSALPVVLVGLWEDLTRRVRPRYRMLAAVASAALASWLAGGVIARLDLPVIDGWLRHLWFVLPLTWFMVAGACNAMNLIDGANGLAGGTALMMFGGLAIAAGWTADPLMVTQTFTIMGAIAGFLIWNYPRGHVFLGDAGAYFLGFMYAVLSIQLVARNDDISAWFVIMLAAYPIVETLFSIYRRKVVRRTASMAPDALHMHTLVYRRLALPAERRRRARDRRRANGRVAHWMWAHGALCLALALLFHQNTPALMIGCVAYAAFYVNRYRALVRFRAQWRRPTLDELDQLREESP